MVRFRLSGIDAPEPRGHTKDEGIIATDALRDKIQGKRIILYSEKTGSFGRWLAEIYFPGEHKSINAWLVDAGYAEYRDYA